MTKYSLSIDLNDKETKTQILSNETAFGIIENILKEYLDGYTILTARGGYKHEDDTNTFIQENSFRVELLFTTDLQVKVIVNRLKTALNQESIAVEKTEIISELW